jgi:hypothetical protein
VVTRETGFSEWLNPGEGVLPFVTLEEALGAIDAVKTRYDEHCRAAQVVAEEYFDAQKVLPRLLEAAMHTGLTAEPGDGGTASARQIETATATR